MTKEPAHPEIGTRIADAMDALGLKLRDVAEHFGKTVQTVHNWRKGKHLPNPPEFLQLADLLKVNAGKRSIKNNKTSPATTHSITVLPVMTRPSMPHLFTT